MQERWGDNRLFYTDQLDFVNEIGVGGYHFPGTPGAVCKTGGNVQQSFAARLHPGNTVIPALNYLVSADFKRHGLAAIMFEAAGTGWVPVYSKAFEAILER